MDVSQFRKLHQLNVSKFWKHHLPKLHGTPLNRQGGRTKRHCSRVSFIVTLAMEAKKHSQFFSKVWTSVHDVLIQTRL